VKKLALIVSLFLCACAHTPVPFDLPAEAQSISIPVEDLRPESEKNDEIFSLLVTSSQYGIYRKGDKTLSPPITDIFRWMVFERLGETEKNLKISVYHMVVYMNMKSMLRRQAFAFPIGGAIGVIIAGNTVASTVNISQSLVDREQFEHSSKTEAHRAFYSEEENPGNAPIFVIYIDAAVKDKRVFIKTIAPLSAPDGQYPLALAVEGAIQYWLDQYSSTK